MLIDASHSGELRVALINEKRKLIDLHIERNSQQKKQSNIYKGKITSIEESLGAIFVNYGDNQRHGFLPFKEISHEYFLAEPKYKNETIALEKDNEQEQHADQDNASFLIQTETDAHTDIKKLQCTEAVTDANQPPHEDHQFNSDSTASAGAIEPCPEDQKNDALACKKSHTPIRRPTNQAPINLKEILKVGQELVVQVEKDERGNKGAALTTYISLAGAYLVLMPNNSRAGGVSRRIAGNERDSLRDTIKQLNLPESMGVIVRTAGVNQTLDTLQWDLEILMQYWEAIKQAAIAKAGPYLIHQESDIIIRSIRDHLKKDVSEIIINEEDCYHRANQYIASIRPEFQNQLKLHTSHLPLFTEYQIEKQIELAHKREIRLPSGGSIVIDHTEALISIDINSSRSTKGKGIEETAYNTNLEAATEIARQLRIRDIGGLIVIDFIDMNNNRHQKEVENRLRDAVKMDRARIQIGRISQKFGLLEMSRQRVGQSLRMSSHMKCPRCSGVGIIRTIESQAFALLHLIQEQAAKHAHQHFQLQLPINVATYLINEKRAELSKIELNQQCHITIVPNPNLESPSYILKQTRVDPNNSRQRLQASYKLLQIPKIKNKPPASLTDKKIEVPAVKPSIPSRELPTKKNNEPGVFQKLWDKMRGIDQSTEKTSYNEKHHTTPSQQQHTHRSHKKHAVSKNQSRKPNKKNTSDSQSNSFHGSETKKPSNEKRNNRRANCSTTRKPKHNIQQPNIEDLASQQLQNTISKLQDNPNAHVIHGFEQSNTSDTNKPIMQKKRKNIQDRNTINKTKTNAKNIDTNKKKNVKSTQPNTTNKTEPKDPNTKKIATKPNNSNNKSNIAAQPLLDTTDKSQNTASANTALSLTDTSNAHLQSEKIKPKKIDSKEPMPTPPTSKSKLKDDTSTKQGETTNSPKPNTLEKVNKSYNDK